jgi:hypothetical protein
MDINIQKIQSIKYYKDDLLTRLFAGDRVLGSSEQATVHFLDANSDGDFNDSVDTTARTAFGNKIDTIYNSVFDANGNLKLDAKGNLTSQYLDNKGILKSGSIDINNDGSKDAIDNEILQKTMNIAHKVQEDVKTNLMNAIKSGTVPILGTKFNVADMNFLQEATKNNKFNYVYTEAWYRETGHASKNLFSSKSDFANFFNDLFDRDFNLNQVKEVLLMADKLASKLSATPTTAQKTDCIKRLELYSTLMNTYDSSSKDLLSFDTFASAANIPISSTLPISDIRAYDPALSNIYGSSGNGPKMNELLSVVAADKSDPNSSMKQRYLLSAISEGKLPISGKPLNLNTLNTSAGFATAYDNLDKLFAAIGDDVKTSNLHLDRLASDPLYTSLFDRMGTTGTPAEPWLINELRTKVNNGTCNLSQAEKMIKLSDSLAKTVAASVSDSDFEKKLGLYSKLLLGNNSSVNEKDILIFDNFLSKTPSGASGLALMDSSKLSTYSPGGRLFNTTADGNKMQDLWDVFVGDKSDPNSSTKQRYLLSSISEGKLPISGKPLSLNGASPNFASDYTNLDKLFAAVGDADLMRKLKIDSWVDNLPTAKLSYYRKEDVKRVFNSSFDASSDRVISTFQNLFESGIYDLSSLEYFKDLLENQKKTEADIRDMIKLNILSPEDLNAYSNANPTNVKLKADGTVDKPSQANFWVSQNKIQSAHKTIFEDFLSNNVDSVLKTETYYIEIYDNLGVSGGLAGSSKNNISAFRDAHNRGAEPRELMNLLEYSLTEGLTYADISTPLTFTTGTFGGDKSLLTYLTDPTDSSNKNGLNIDAQFARRHELLKEALVTQSVPAVSGFSYDGSKTEFENLKILLGSVKANGSI